MNDSSIRLQLNSDPGLMPAVTIAFEPGDITRMNIIAEGFEDHASIGSFLRAIGKDLKRAPDTRELVEDDAIPLRNPDGSKRTNDELLAESARIRGQVANHHSRLTPDEIEADRNAAMFNHPARGRNRE